MKATFVIFFFALAGQVTLSYSSFELSFWIDKIFIAIIFFQNLVQSATTAEKTTALNNAGASNYGAVADVEFTFVADSSTYVFFTTTSATGPSKSTKGTTTGFNIPQNLAQAVCANPKQTGVANPSYTAPPGKAFFNPALLSNFQITDVGAPTDVDIVAVDSSGGINSYVVFAVSSTVTAPRTKKINGFAVYVLPNSQTKIMCKNIKYAPSPASGWDHPSEWARECFPFSKEQERAFKSNWIKSFNKKQMLVLSMLLDSINVVILSEILAEYAFA